MTNVIVIGAGASGMMAAICGKMNNSNLKITILEHGQKAGRKLLATGNGRCNLTNRKLNKGCFRSHDGDRIDKWLSICDTECVIDIFNQFGMLCTDRNGYIYPYSLQAATVTDKLINMCEENGIEILTDTHVLDVDKNEDGTFVVNTSKGYEEDGVRKKKRIYYKADKVVLALGSKAYPNLGSDGSGYSIAKKLGLSMVPVVPALTGLKCKENVYKLGAGVRTQAVLEIFVDHEKMATEMGELQLTEYGISGIPVFQISRYASYGLLDGCKVNIHIDFMPEYDREELIHIVDTYIAGAKSQSVHKLMSGMINYKLADMILSYCRIDKEKSAIELSVQERDSIIQTLKAFNTVVTETNDFNVSQICAGGIRLSEVDDDFQSIKHKGLYITGEMLDVDGLCGGYNLHWAWLTGMIAGRGL